MHLILFAALTLSEFVLPNGLRVVLRPDPRSPEVLVHLAYGVGSRDEESGVSGFAHLFEHLMFMGTKRFPNGQFDALMEARGGSNNATTAEDKTSYFERGPRDLLPLFLQLEADRMATLPSAMTRAKVNLQREVVKNERRQSYENRPYGGVELALPEDLYPGDPGYGHPTIGSPIDLDRASVATVKKFFARHYAPDNAVLIVDGDFEVADARREIEKAFAAVGKPAKPRRRIIVESAPLAAPKKRVLTDKVPHPALVLAWRSPAWTDADDASSEVLAVLLGGTKASRLYRALVEEQRIAESVEVDHSGMDGTGRFTIQAIARDGHDAAELERAISAEIAALETKPFSAQEIEHAAAFVETELLRALDGRGTRAELLARIALVGEPLAGVDERLLSYVRSVNPKSIERVQQRILGKPRVDIVVLPAEKP